MVQNTFKGHGLYRHCQISIQRLFDQRKEKEAERVNNVPVKVRILIKWQQEKSPRGPPSLLLRCRFMSKHSNNSWCWEKLFDFFYVVYLSLLSYLFHTNEHTPNAYTYTHTLIHKDPNKDTHTYTLTQPPKLVSHIHTLEHPPTHFQTHILTPTHTHIHTYTHANLH